jgi:hypothetical protein
MDNYLPQEPIEPMRDFHPAIKNFAMPTINRKEDAGKKHTCSITFQAPSDVKEHDMMDYILGIESALGANVVKFTWTLSEDKNKD